jgi:hypothetical protein
MPRPRRLSEKAAPPAAAAQPTALPAPAATAEAQLERLIHGAAAATLVYGDTGSGKTTLIGTFAKWVWRKFHVVTRLYTYDPGGYSDDILALVKLGIIEVWRVYTRDPQGLRGLPSETIQRAAQGWWPAEIDPATGESPLGIRLEEPPADLRFAMAQDGLTSMCDWSMDDMGQRAAFGTLGGEGSNLKTIESGDLKMGVGNRASVGFVQNKVRNWVLNSLAVRNLVTAPLFTALELKVLDSDRGLPLYGPKIAGQAKTTDVPAWFGATLGSCLEKDEKGNPEWRLHLRDYTYPPTDPTPHKCKIRASAQLPTAELLRLPSFLSDPIGTEPLTKFNLGYFFDVLEDIRLKTLARAASEFPEAPGLKKSTIGTTPPPTRRAPESGGAPLPPGLRRIGTLPAPVEAKKEEAPATPPSGETAPAPAAEAPPPAPPELPPLPSAPALKRLPSSTVTVVTPQAPVSAPAAPQSPGAQATGTAGRPALRPAPAGLRPIQRAPVAAAPAKKPEPRKEKE